jgi:hypothetical protein
MGKKRGRYRKYTKDQRRRAQRKQYAKNYKATEWQMKAVREETFGAKIAAGRRMFVRAVYLEKLNHFIGKHIVIKERDVDGLVVGIYPHFLLVDCGDYKTTISYTDLVLGGRVS